MGDQGDRLKTAAIGFLLAIGGLYLPDIDIVLPILNHRSAVTHSALLPALAAIRHPYIGGCLAFGVSAHLTADLFPKAWIGYAKIHAPFMGSLDALSPVWILVNAALCLTLAYHFTSKEFNRGTYKAHVEIIHFLCGALISALYFALDEGKPLILIPFLGAWAGAIYALGRRRRAG